MAGVTPKEIRQEIVAILKASTLPNLAAIPNTQIHDSRTTPIEADRRPALDVTTESGDSEGTSGHFGRFTRTIRATIRGYEAVDHAVDGPDVDADVAARLNDIEEDVRAALFTNQSFIGDKRSLRRVSVARGVDSESAHRSVMFALTLEIDVDEDYDPDLTGADDFATLNVDTDMIEPGGTVDGDGNPIPDGDIDSSITITGLDL